jgi:hypothetical protein
MKGAILGIESFTSCAWPKDPVGIINPANGPAKAGIVALYISCVYAQT